MNNRLLLRFSMVLTLIMASHSCQIHALSEAAVNALSAAATVGGAGVGYLGAWGTKKAAHDLPRLNRMGMGRFVDNHSTAFDNRLWAGVGAAIAGVTTRILLHQFTPSGRYNKAKAIYDAYNPLVFTRKKLTNNQYRNAEIYADAGYISKPGQSYIIQAHVDLGYAGQDLKFAQELLAKARQDLPQITDPKTVTNDSLVFKVEELMFKIKQAKEVVMHNIMHIEQDSHFPSAYRIYLAERNAVSNEKVADATATYAKIGISREIRGWLGFLSHFNFRGFINTLMAPIRFFTN